MKSLFEKKCNEYRENKRLIEELTALNEELKTDIITMMNGQETVIQGAAKVTYKSVNTSRFNSKEFKEVYPSLYDEYTTQSSYKRFTVN